MTRIFLIMALFGLLLTSCWQKKPYMQISKIKGTYVFNYPSGEVEVLIINEDSTYRKYIYMSYNDFRSKSEPPQYMNEGSLTISDDDGELIFNDWLMYNRLRDPTVILSEPIKVMMTNVFWRRATSNNNATIALFDETGYVFEKIKK